MAAEELGKVFNTAASPVTEEARNERMKRLMTSVAESSPTAFETLQNASLRGCKYKFTGDMDKTLGTYNRADKTIYLNEKHSDAVLSTVLVHEARHAVQHNLHLSADRNTATLLTMWRASEADAMAFECAAAYEMQNDNPEAWFKFKNMHRGIAVAFSREMKASRDERNALSEAFKAWYDDAPYVAEYDKDALQFLEDSREKAGWSFLKDNVAGERVAFNLCRKGDDLYLRDVVFLSSERAMTIDADIARRCRGVADDALFLYGRQDRSLDRLFVRDENGTVHPMKTETRPARPQDRLKEQERSINQEIGEALPPWVRDLQAKKNVR
ncbi:MAG: DUF6782 family putative metallopeptidase [Alphaproteobacteria bacterium]|jgi:hypothetical protein